MRTADTILGVIRERGRRGLPLERVYRLLFNPELYLIAYGRIARNAGATTAGVTAETADGMSLAKIETIIEAVRFERYRWTPVRRVYIEKKNSTKKRPLGIPAWSDKLLQEVVRLILEAYFEPQFSPLSHGFRPGRGCHTALQEVYHVWSGTTWFVEGDISACFDSLDHGVMLATLAEKIHDGRFLRLIANLLKAGYLEDWKFNATLSGTPQGGVASPILSNIYLDRLDKWVETTLLPAYNRGAKRKPNLEYRRLLAAARCLEQRGQKEDAVRLRQQAQQLPSQVPDDPDYRRLRYLRYADDFLLSFIGPRKEAEEIKERLTEFLRDDLKLELSQAKTLVTHARTSAARFLGYEVGVFHADTKHDQHGHRCINGRIRLGVPAEVVRAKCAPYMRDGEPIDLPARIHDSEYSVVAQYQQEYRGAVEYYQLAHNLHTFNRLRWAMEGSLAKTLARKLEISVRRVYHRFQRTIQTDRGPRKVLQVVVERSEGKRSLVTHWGAITLARRKDAVLNDDPPRVWNARTELLERLLADECELCGSHEDVEVHHVRHLKDLQRKGRGKPPRWVEEMVSRHRKTLIVCRACHLRIHTGRTGDRTPAAVMP
jgi:group II intron reverse transcriptase/maturase